MANYPVSIVYDDGFDIYEGNFNLNAILLSKIEVTTNPAKMTGVNTTKFITNNKKSNKLKLITN